jgi:rare lipoprotein A
MHPVPKTSLLLAILLAPIGCKYFNDSDSAGAESTTHIARATPSPTPTATPTPTPAPPKPSPGDADTDTSEDGDSESVETSEGQITDAGGDTELQQLYNEHGVKWPMAKNDASPQNYANQSGEASYYTSPQKTASGDYYDPSDLTAAHKKLPFGTLVKCTCEDTGKSVMVMINDRGPFVEGRIIDLSTAAAKKLGIAGRKGTTPVELTILAYPLEKVHKPKEGG